MTNLARLYDIEQQYLELLYEVEEAFGEITPEQEAALAITKETFVKKLQAYNFRIKSMDGEIEMLKDTIAKFNQAIKAKENIKKYLKTRMIHALTLFGTPTKSGGYQYKDETVNMYTVSKNSVEPLADVEDFGKFSIVNVDLHLNKAQLDKVYEFIETNFGMDTIVQKGVALKKTYFMDQFKSGTIVNKTYYFDNGKEVVEADKEEGVEYETIDILTDIIEDVRYPNIKIVDNTSLTIK